MRIRHKERKRNHGKQIRQIGRGQELEEAGEAGAEEGRGGGRRRGGSLWHGPELHYVFGVGILQFLYIFLGEISRPVFTKLDRLLHLDGKRLPLRIIRSVRCTLLMMFAWIFFNASSVSAALAMLKSMFTQPKPGQVTDVFLAAGVDGQMRTLIWFAVCIALTVAIDILHEKGISLRSSLALRPYPVRLAVYLMLAFALIIFGAYGGSYSTGDFIYTGF